MRSPTRCGPARLGLDIGVLDEGRLEHALGHGGTGRKGFGGIAAPHPAIQQEILGLVGLHQRRVRGGRRVDPEDGGSGVQAIGTSSSAMASTAARSPTSATTASPR